MPGKPVPPARREEIVSAVVAGLSDGVPLNHVLAGMGITVQTFQNWRDSREEIALAVEAARDLGFDKLAYECLAIADDREGDVLWDSEGNPHPNGANVLARKLSVETRLKLLAKWDPRRYGDSKRVEVEANVNVTQRHVIDSRVLTDDGRAALRRLLAEAQAKGLLPPPDDPADVLDGVYHEVIGDSEAESADDGEIAED